MQSEVRQFIIETLQQMNYDVSGVTADTVLGPAGLDLESLAVAELAVMVEDRYRVTFGEKDTETLAAMTIDEFAAEIAHRLSEAATSAAS